MAVLPGLALLLSCSGGGEENRESPAGPEAGSVAETWTEPGEVDGPRVVVIGFDGVDPDLVEQFSDHLPRLSAYMEAGRMHRLGTTTPPQSPVAWSSFATSTNPGAHGIFDFVNRNPNTYFPNVGTNSYSGPEFEPTGRVSAPGHASSPRVGTPFWQHVAEAGLPVRVLSVPYSFPPQNLGSQSAMLSGLGTPDLRLTNSTFFLFGTDISAEQDRKNVSGGDLVPLVSAGAGFTGEVSGPSGLSRGSRESVVLTFTPELAANTVEIQGGGASLTATLGAFSEFATLEFPVSNFYVAKALVRFFPIQVGEEIRVYMSPLMLHPEEPYIPFSYPDQFAAQLAVDYGDFKTIGWIHDTSALNSESISDEIFARDMEAIFQQRLQMTLGELRKKNANLFISVFTATDRAGHLFMRFLDENHARHEDPESGQEDLILRTYTWMDEALGQIEAELGEDDTLIVLSDHGFHTFRRGLRTNSWLLDQGYLALTAGTTPGKGAGVIHGNIDWSRTRAYAMGTGQIYINLEGRERDGIVAPEDYESTCREIAVGLEALTDPETGASVVDRVFLRGDVWRGQHVDTTAPDLQLGFADGYQSDRSGTALGGVPEGLFGTNEQKWSGDHAASDPADTEGFLLVNRDGISGEVHIIDIAPTVLSLLGVTPPADYEGRALGVEQ